MVIGIVRISSIAAGGGMVLHPPLTSFALAIIIVMVTNSLPLLG